MRRVLPLDSPDASLPLVGGKGRSLAILAAAGLPVPGGFLVSTEAYQEFVAHHDLQGAILELLEQPDPSDEIRALFDVPMAPQALDEIGRAAATLDRVAVRSSATAEDLPGLSFAGQQDTYLNVRGEQEVLDAIRRCWASLWTARAIDYRRRMGVDQRRVAMGVVVQQMVEAEVSGILFTANPTTGKRSEILVNASFGLGEAVVGGLVTPDSYVVDRESLATTEARLGAKRQMIVSAETGVETRPVPEAQRPQRALSDDQLRELAALALRAQALLDQGPQDVEWALADGRISLLQSRPITRLPPDVEWQPPTVGATLIRRQVVENMPDPLSPLFDELYLQIGLDRATDHFVRYFGMHELDIDMFVERPMFLTVNGYAYCRGSYRWSWRLLTALPGILFAYLCVLPGLLRQMERRWRRQALPEYLETIEQWKGVAHGRASDARLLAGLRALSEADARYWFHISIMVGGAKVTDGLLNCFLSSRLVPGELRSGMFLRGFESMTIQSQTDLEAIADRIRSDEHLHALVVRTDAAELLDALGAHPGGQPVLDDIREYLERYGQQVYNLDFAEATQLEDPSAILTSLGLLVAGGGFDTRAKQAALVRERDALIATTARSVGPFRRWMFRKFLRWARAFGPCREEALFYMGAAWSTLRGLALELGRRRVAQGLLRTADDVFFLEMSELADTDAGAQQRVDERRALRQARALLHPPGIIPVGERWTLGMVDMTPWETQKRNADDADVLTGFPVSPGSVTGIASVILSPADFHEMRAETILVCPTTTPAWTPLFAHAAALVTDIGGILAHGSIVAREYGIPAVLGTGNATRRITSGQRITVDGVAGTVVLHDD